MQLFLCVNYISLENYDLYLRMDNLTTTTKRLVKCINTLNIKQRITLHIKL